MRRAQKGDTPPSLPFRWDPIVVDRIDVYRVALPLTNPYVTSFGSIATNHSIIMRIEANGREAWSESSPFEAPEFSGEWAASVVLALRDWLCPAILGVPVTGASELTSRLNQYRGNWFAKAAVDIAFWSLAALIADKPLHEFVGGTRNMVEVGAAFGVAPSIDVLLGQVDHAVNSGIRRVKLKMTTGWERDVVAAVRDAYPNILLHVDCNGHYTLDDVDLFRAIDRFGLAMVEQPLAYDDLIDHAKLQRLIETPVCLDESITSPARARQAIELGSCRLVNIKPGRVGGLTAALMIDTACSNAGIATWVGGMLESQLGEAICVALATRPNMTYPGDIFPAERFYAADLSVPHIAFVRGSGGGLFARPTPTPGLEQRPDPDRLATYTIEHFAMRAGNA
jgi:O-succinylbenzoate synthase